MQANRSHRPAFTLVEMLTVIAIIAILAALTAIYFPRFQDQELVNRGADQVQGWLLNAKMQAKRDGLPTGVRLNLVGTTVTNVDYIQQPNNYAQGVFTGADVDPNPNPALTPGFPRAKFILPTPPAVPTVVTFFTPITVSGSSAFVVQPGDYLELFGGGVLHRIVRIPQPSSDPAPYFPPSAGENAALILEKVSAPIPTLTPPLSSAINYRIIPAPRTISGEQTLTLPTNVAISFETPLSTSPTFTLSQNIPVRGTFLEILFAPSGAVIGQGTGTGQIILWVRDITKPMPVSPTPDWLVGKGTLITVQPRTGFIAAHPVTSGADPYLFTRDGRSSGL
jgi:prepilin-type N-terminal cleavage/methylation domain-containing protein